MSITVAKLDSSINPFDSWQSLALSLYMIAGCSSRWCARYKLCLGQPTRFSEVQVGRVAGVDLGGLSVGAVATSDNFSHESASINSTGILIAVLSNAACISITS